MQLLSDTRIPKIAITSTLIGGVGILTPYLSFPLVIDWVAERDRVFKENAVRIQCQSLYVIGTEESVRLLCEESTFGESRDKRIIAKHYRRQPISCLMYNGSIAYCE